MDVNREVEGYWWPQGGRDRCPDPCDHCRPEELHPCMLAPGHEGWHSCQTGSNNRSVTS